MLAWDLLQLCRHAHSRRVELSDAMKVTNLTFDLVRNSVVVCDLGGNVIEKTPVKPYNDMLALLTVVQNLAKPGSKVKTALDDALGWPRGKKTAYSKQFRDHDASTFPGYDDAEEKLLRSPELQHCRVPDNEEERSKSRKKIACELAKHWLPTFLWKLREELRAQDKPIILECD